MKLWCNWIISFPQVFSSTSCRLRFRFVSVCAFNPVFFSSSSILFNTVLEKLPPSSCLRPSLGYRSVISLHYCLKSILIIRPAHLHFWVQFSLLIFFNLVLRLISVFRIRCHTEKPNKFFSIFSENIFILFKCPLVRDHVWSEYIRRVSTQVLNSFMMLIEHNFTGWSILVNPDVKCSVQSAFSKQVNVPCRVIILQLTVKVSNFVTKRVSIARKFEDVLLNNLACFI